MQDTPVFVLVAFVISTWNKGGEEGEREADNENPCDKTFQGRMILSSREKRIGKSWKEALEERRLGEFSDKKLNDKF